MEKHNKQFSVKSVLKSLLPLVMLLIGFNVQAIKITEIELGVEYSGNGDAYFSFTPTEDGKLVVTGKEVPDPFVDAEFTIPYNEYTFAFIAGGKEIEMNVVKGTTYYLAMLNTLSAWSFSAQMADATNISIESTNHPVGEVFPLDKGGLLSITFDTGITIGTTTVKTGDATTEISGMVYGKDVSYELKNVLFPWLQNGTMKAGDIFTITINDVKSIYDPNVLYNGDGIVTLSFIAPVKPAEVIKEILPAEFLSYWSTNADDGVVTLEYDTDLSVDYLPIAKISFGSTEVEDDYYTEEIPVVITGKTLSIDFRGKRRIPAEMVASGKNYGTMRLSISNIHSIDGNYVYSTSQGSYGSYQHSFTYTQIETNLAHEFTPASGASLTGVTSVELWLSTPDAITFDGVQVAYKSVLGIDEVVTYTNEECNYQNEGADGIILEIPITTEMQAGTNVTITLTNVVSLDGIEHEIMAVYNEKQEVLTLVSTSPEVNAIITPAEAGTIEFVFDDDIVVTEDASVAIMDMLSNGYTATIDVLPMTPNTVIVRNFQNENGDILENLPNGSYIVQLAEGSVAGLTNGLLNETIEVIFTVKDDSPQDPLSIFTFTPAAGSTVESLYTISVVHTEFINQNIGKAELKDAEGNVVATVANAEQVIPEEEADNWDYMPTEIVLTLNTEITAEGTYTLSMPEGFLIYGSNYENSPAIDVPYTIGTVSPNLILTSTNPENGSTISSEDAYMIQFIFDEDVTITKDATISITDRLYNSYTATLRVYPTTLNTATVMNFTNESGKFFENLPNGSYFVQLGAGSVAGVESGKLNEAVEISFTVGEAGPVDPSTLFTFTPAVNSTVESLKEIYIEHAESLNANLGTAELKDANGNVVATGTAETYIPEDKQDDYDNFQYEPVIVIVTLDKEITAEGTYTLSMPEGFLIYGIDYENSPAMDVTYTIGAATPVLTLVSTNPGMNATVDIEEANMIQFFFDEDIETTQNVSISIVDDLSNKYTATVKVDAETSTAVTVINFYNASFKFFKSLPEATYTVNLAAGSVAGIASGELNEDIEITFTVSDQNGLNSLFDDEVSRYDVYTINGVRVMSTTEKAHLNELEAGFYIINGKKIYLRK